jgi:hypothetical protein
LILSESSSDSSSESSSEESIVIKKANIERNNKPTTLTNPNSTKTGTSKVKSLAPKIIYSESESDDEIIFINQPKTQINSKKQQNTTKNNPNYAKDNIKSNNESKNQKTIIQEDPKTKKFKTEVKICNINENIENNFELIPSPLLDDLASLKLTCPDLFSDVNLPVLFRVYELSLTFGGISPSIRRSGTIQQFVEDSKSFIIKLDKDNNLEIDNILDNFGVDLDMDIICVSLKDFIELWVPKSSLKEKPENQILNKPAENPKLPQNNENQELSTNKVNLEEPSTNNNSQNINPRAKENNSKDIPINQNTNKLNMFQRIILPQIKKQIEYYFSDKNYYKDKFLLEKASLNCENCKFLFKLVIELKYILGFNKIKALTDNLEDLALAIKDSSVAELNSDNTMLRKKVINKEFFK